MNSGELPSLPDWPDDDGFVESDFAEDFPDDESSDEETSVLGRRCSASGISEQV